MYKLAQALPESIWNEYDHHDMKKLADRININNNNNNNFNNNINNHQQQQQQNGCCENKDTDTDMDTDLLLPQEFLDLWNAFMEQYGYDGQDQMFISCPRYDDSPELLLQKLKMNATGHVKDPAITAQEQITKRRIVMAKHEQEAKAKKSKANILRSFKYSKALSKIKKRNEILDHVMWMRNAPKFAYIKSDWNDPSGGLADRKTIDCGRPIGRTRGYLSSQYRRGGQGSINIIIIIIGR